MTVAEKVRVQLVKPGDIFEDMNAAVGPRERSSFIADAVAKELEGRRDGSYRAGDKCGQKNRGTGQPVRTHAVLPADVLHQVHDEVGTGNRSVFVTEAVDRFRAGLRYTQPMSCAVRSRAGDARHAFRGAVGWDSITPSVAAASS
ncbi:MAG: hypothetical protein H0W06_05820 [Chloroflexia bacterium]|nr:hypothetical protein [Chloroflexia bacterium]